MTKYNYKGNIKTSLIGALQKATLTTLVMAGVYWFGTRNSPNHSFSIVGAITVFFLLFIIIFLLMISGVWENQLADE